MRKGVKTMKVLEFMGLLGMTLIIKVDDFCHYVDGIIINKITRLSLNRVKTGYVMVKGSVEND